VHNEEGKPIFKLDQLAPANGIKHNDAHDALADTHFRLESLFSA
jgi:exodeoxyribonuclease-1